jgi:hypothetical protein
MNFRKVILGLIIVCLAFTAASAVSYVLLWRVNGLDHLGPEDTGAAVGAFAVFVRSCLNGAGVALCSGVGYVILITRSERKIG